MASCHSSPYISGNLGNLCSVTVAFPAEIILCFIRYKDKTMFWESVRKQEKGKSINLKNICEPIHKFDSENITTVGNFNTPTKDGNLEFVVNGNR